MPKCWRTSGRGAVTFPLPGAYAPSDQLRLRGVRRREEARGGVRRREEEREARDADVACWAWRAPVAWVGWEVLLMRAAYHVGGASHPRDRLLERGKELLLAPIGALGALLRRLLHALITPLRRQPVSHRRLDFGVVFSALRGGV
eukprot:scaffold60943_cov73-Phaeocystis_antarctica.AAC.2